MDFTIEQIQALKKEIEGIWTHLNNIEKQLGSADSTGFRKTAEAGKSEKKKGSEDSTNATIDMMERMKRKIDTHEQEAELYGSDDLDRRIDNAFLGAEVKKALAGLKEQLGIE